ncbi:hypothetical protein TeGR_g3159 [Tetraparma gracilis]|uniref:Uncharacterized protein n=1 Tax=Tetraparma gracilis TaxID=2962635 RepID=A0ABQ6MIA0_9STRA|nr:hypothetical protein TeGR_g3159 [Tetraparma gracilis]
MTDTAQRCLRDFPEHLASLSPPFRQLSSPPTAPAAPLPPPLLASAAASCSSSSSSSFALPDPLQPPLHLNLSFQSSLPPPHAPPTNHLPSLPPLLSSKSLLTSLHHSPPLSYPCVPASFDLSSPPHLSEHYAPFLEHYQSNAAVSLLMLAARSTVPLPPDLEEPFRLALRACSSLLSLLARGPSPPFVDQSCDPDPAHPYLHFLSLAPPFWSLLVSCLSSPSCIHLLSHQYAGAPPTPSPALSLLASLLPLFERRFSSPPDPRNLWILKAPASCRGLSITLSSDLPAILARCKQMGGRVVQK